MLNIHTCRSCAVSQKQTPVFFSGFEGSSAIANQASEGAELSGSDPSAPWPNSWDSAASSPYIGLLNLQYQDYDSLRHGNRRAEIVSDPTGCGRGNVLKYWMTDDNASFHRGRIQMNCYGAEKGLKDYYQKTSFYLPSESFQPIINDSSEVGFLTIREIWNNNNWYPAFGEQEAYPFRINVNVIKHVGSGEPLHLRVIGELQSRPCCWGEGHDRLWEEETDFSLPLNVWIDLELYIKEGDAKSGRFVLALTPKDEPRRILFDINGATYNPNDPKPDGIKYFNPIKMYTKDYITIDKCVSAGDSLKMYWDDLELWEGKRIK